MDFPTLRCDRCNEVIDIDHIVEHGKHLVFCCSACAEKYFEMLPSIPTDFFYLPDGTTIELPAEEVDARRKAVASVLPIALWAMEKLTDSSDSYRSGEEYLDFNTHYIGLEGGDDCAYDLSGNDTPPPFVGFHRPFFEGTDEPDPDAADQWVISVENLDRQWKHALDVLREAVGRR